MTASSDSAVVADIGGTNARFALAADPTEPARLSGVKRYRCADFPTVEDALAQFFTESGLERAPRDASLAVASPVKSDVVYMTNHHWCLSKQSLAERFGFKKIAFINDFVAISLSLPLLRRDEFASLGGPPLDDAIWREGAFRVAVMGPGTGLGVAGLIGTAAGAFVLDTEGGHAAFAPTDDLEIEILKVLLKGRSRISNERLLSGMGLSHIYQALVEIEGAEPEAIKPADITRRALVDRDPLCSTALARFCAILGSVAGDVALMMGATSGVFVGGGIVLNMLEYLRTSDFRGRFEAKGRFDGYMKAIPTQAILAKDSGLIGAAAAIKREVG